MPRIPAHNLDTAPPATHNMLAALRQRYGRLLNVHAGMAHAPVVLAAYTTLKAAIAEHATFDTATQEAIALAVSAADKCDYCQAAHTGAARKAGLTLELTVAIRSGVPTDPKLDAGWSLEQLAELFAHLVPNMFTNYFNHYAHTELDLLPAPPKA